MGGGGREKEEEQKSFYRGIEIWIAVLIKKKKINTSTETSQGFIYFNENKKYPCNMSKKRVITLVVFQHPRPYNSFKIIPSVSSYTIALFSGTVYQIIQLCKQLQNQLQPCDVTSQPKNSFQTHWNFVNYSLSHITCPVKNLIKNKSTSHKP